MRNLTKTLGLLAALSLCASGAPARAGEPGGVIAAPEGLLAQELLAGLDAATRDARKETVAAALDAYPGSAEVFALALLEVASQDKLWADPARLFGPLDPGAAGFTYGGRAFAVEAFAPGALDGLSVTRGDVRYVPARTGYVSPLVLDLEGDGIDIGARWQPHTGIDTRDLLIADINSDGFPEVTEWVQGTDGILVDPEDPSRISRGLEGLVWTGPWSGRDLVGTAEGYRDGFEKLSLRDADHDGVVAGAELEGLHVWQDLDADAAMDPGELKTLGAWGVTALRPPAPGEAVGSFTAEGRAGMLWDWWPSYAVAKKAPVGPVAPGETTLDLTGKTITLEVEEIVIGPPADLDLDGFSNEFRMQAAVPQQLAFSTLRLAAVSPDGEWIVLLHRGLPADRVKAGAASALVAIHRQGDAYGTLRYGVGLTDTEQVVFDTLHSVIVTGDGGGKIVRIDLESRQATLLHEPVAGRRGFRCGGLAWNGGEARIGSFFDVFVEGYFYDEKQVAGPQRVARLSPAPGLGGAGWELGHLQNQVEVADMEGEVRARLYHCCRTGGGGIEGYMFIARPVDVSSVQLLRVAPGADPVPVDEGVLLRGAAASGSRLLYFRRPSLADLAPGEAEVVLADLETGEKRVLGTGDYCYPYLGGGGTVAVVAKIDWKTGGMQFLVAANDGPMPQFRSLRPFLSSRGIGTFRLSADGRTFAFLGPEYLEVRSMDFGEIGFFLRGNANGSAVPEGAPWEAIDISDAIFLLSFLFLGGPQPPCMDAADSNDDGKADISDAVRTLGYLFGGGTTEVTLPPPWPELGPDPTADDLSCDVPQG
ncbi:MAG: hypothetical protein HY721_29910 [Planctomycetes bacterium]|nr:hypothetical protein [Planctomycetota bacterium]